MRAEVGKPKRPIPEVTVDEALKARVAELSRETILQTFQEPEKQVRHQTMENSLAGSPHHPGRGI